MEETKHPSDVVSAMLAEALREVEISERALRRSSRRMLQAIPVRDLRALRSGLADWRGQLGDLETRVSLAEEEMSRYSVPAEDPEFLAEYARAVEQQVERAGILLEGRFPQYVAFPIEITIDLAREQARVNNRQVNALDPKALAGEITNEYKRVHSAAFNGQRFMKALSTAYDLLTSLQKSSQTTVRQMPLKKMHELLTMRTGPSAYTLRQFAFDIYKLRNSTDLTFGGHRLAFVNTRRPRDMVPVPISPGNYENLGYLELVPVEGGLIG